MQRYEEAQATLQKGWATLKGEKANIFFGWLFPCVYYTLG